MKKVGIISSIGFLFLAATQVWGAGGAVVPETLDEVLNKTGIWTLFGASILLAFLALTSLHIHHLRTATKKILYLSIIGVTIAATLYLVGSTVYLNTVSSSKGPVHWHADIEVWACGQEINLQDPKGLLSNKIGTSTLHEHNDKRIHLEGVVIGPTDTQISNFFRVIGGSLTASSFTVPQNSGLVTYQNGMPCPDGSVGEVQVFVYKTQGDTYTQEKLADPERYSMSPEGNVPPGDCVIIEFDSPKPATDKLCRSYKVAEYIGKIKRGM